MRRALLVAAALWQLGCPTLHPDPPGLPPDDGRARAWVDAVARHSAGRQALRGRARIAVDGEEQGLHLRARQRLVLERPDRLRVEILGLLAQTQAVLVTDAGRFELFLVSDRSYESGEIYPGLLWNVAGIPLEPDEVVELVLGAPLPAGPLQVQTARAAPEGRVAVEVSDARSGERWQLDFDGDGLLRRLHAGTAARRYTADFDDYAPIESELFAHRISLDFPEVGTRAELLLREVELDPELPGELFRLRDPRGAGLPGG